MSRFFLLITSFAVLFAALLGANYAAADDFYLSEEKVKLVEQSCVQSQAVMSQLHASDALLRVNRGSLYNQISSKLMAPLGSRIALNRLGGIKLSTTAVEYDQKLEDFRSSYKVYEEAMSKALKINCKKRPVEFYKTLSDAREKRQVLHASTRELNELLKTYQADFEDFAKKVEGSDR